MKRTFLVFFLLLGCTDGLAQNRPARVAPYRSYATAEGLPHENILALAQGTDHRLYAGTLLGLAVYNGESVQTVSFPDSLSSRSVHELAPGPDGTVWGSVGSNTIFQVEGQWIRRAFSVEGGVEDVLFHQDTLYIFTGADGYWTLPPGAAEPTHHTYSFSWSLWRSPEDSTSGRGVEDATVSPSGEIWIVDGRRGPGRLRDDGTIAFAGVTEAEAGHWWVRLQFFEPGTALLTRSDEVYEFDVESGRIRHLLSASGPLVTYRQDDHLIYMKGDVRRRLPSHDDLRSLTELGIPVSSGNHAVVDHEGSLWLGTKAGLFQLYGQGVRHQTRIGKTPLTNVGAFSRHADSTLWAISWGQGLIRVRPNPTIVQPRGETRWTYVASGPSTVHSLSPAGWYRYEQRRGWHRVGPFNQAIRGVVAPNGNGYFWHDDGLYHRSPGEQSVADTLFQWPTTQRDYTSVGPHNNGGFVLRVRDQLYRGRFGENGSPPALQPMARLPGYESARGRFLEADRHGRVWLAFWNRGLVRVDPRTSPVTVDSLLVDRPLRRVTLSGDSLALVTALDGLYMIDAEHFRLQRHLTSDDGLLGTTVGGAKFFNDTLYVSHHRGLTMIPRRALYGRSAAPRVLFTSLERGGRKEPVPSDSTFQADQRAITFNFSAPTFRTPGRIRYDYRLRPGENQWKNSERSVASYTNLPPGEYRFEVRARIPNGPVGPKTSYSFRIPRFFYETIWFRVLAGIVLLALGVAVYHWRVRHLHRRQRELEQAVDEQTRELQREKQTTEQQAERLIELDEAKNRFFANISHEFRTPLTLITGPIQSLLNEDDGPVTDAQANKLRLMQQNANRLLDLIGQLLDLARLDAGELELRRKPGNLVDFLAERVRAFEPLAERTDVSLHFRPDVDQLRFQYDHEKLRKVVDNLLSNAIEYTPQGGDVWVSTHRAATESSVDIVVKDTGPGLSEENVEHLFDRFTQGDNAARRESDGAGIGLALAQELVELHGGSIRVRSESGYGTAFIVHLPVEEELELDPVQAPEPPDPTEDQPVTVPSRSTVSRDEESSIAIPDDPSDNGQTKILVVEDNEDVRALLQQHLCPNHEIVEASDGRTGLEAARTHEPDLIISDVMMPKMDGFALCEAVKTDETLATTPVVLLTAKAGPTHERHGLEKGADAYVAKPFDADVLRVRVENLIANRRRLEEVFGKHALVEASGEAVSEDTASFLEDVLAVVEDRLDDSTFSVDDLASAVALSRRQLSRRLKDATGDPPAALIRRVRLHRAAEMLKTDASSVSQVAYAVGYKSPSHFSRAFRKHFDCTPSEYAESA